ncbi:MAG: Nif3-like dinuclear metal center hexameric protein [Oscillospiraceae bacterium]|nr:Nif3-like dinuclear metal center hexameric protein [Oscillospiraceae bacterium]
MTVQDVYDILDAFAPFSTQESYDKAGLLTGDPQAAVHRILLTLDITIPVVREAAEKHCDLILAHHPVIWEPLKAVMPNHPAWHLVRHDIAAICSHTCLDLAEGGLNDYAGELLAAQIAMQHEYEPLAVLSGGRTLGRTAVLSEPTDADTLADRLRAAFRCRSLRYYAGARAAEIRKIAWCTGSGGDLIPEAIAAGADALITGDCKHSVWAEAQNRSFTLFDCGHFETEVPVVQLFQRILRNAGAEAELIVSETGTQPFFIAAESES